MKRLITIIICLAVGLVSYVQVIPVIAEPDYSDTVYWNDKCTGKSSLSTADKEACTAYAKYLRDQNEGFSEQLKEIDAEREEISANLESYAVQIDQYQEQIDAKQVEIDAKQIEINDQQARINAKQAEIDQKVTDIENNEKEVEKVRTKLAQRMVNSQSTMRLNKYVDVLMGAKSFDEFLRIANGLSAIAEFDNRTMNQIIDLIRKLNVQKEELQAARDEMAVEMNVMEIQQAQLVAQQNEIEEVQYRLKIIEEEATRQLNALREQSEQIATNIEAQKAVMLEIANTGAFDAIDMVTGSSGWVVPVASAYMSGPTWYYYGSDVIHLGVDFAAPIGTPILAAGDGVIILSSDGCPTNAYLSTCGYSGLTGGGNHVYLLTVINGGLYCIQYAHMMQGSPVPLGTVVTAGQQIGAVGASGMVTGPHTHVEVFYLGDGSQFTEYATNWDGNLSFYNGWGYTGLANRCEVKGSAPCRVKPETVFGG